MFDAIVLAGATSRRLDGADKPAIEVHGRTLLDIALSATDGAQRIVVAGPERSTERPVTWAEEDPPGGGPVAGIAAALESVTSFWCVVLASDLPRIGPAVPVLLTAAGDADVAVLSRDGERNYLAAVWRTDALRAALGRLERVDGAAVRELFAGADVVDVIDENDWGADVDTWTDVERARHA